MSELLESHRVSLDEILGNGKIYKIPDFQRDYSWSKENWEDLWFDMVELLDQKSAHYMGSIVLQNTLEEKKYLVVDGQQRLTTLSIFILSVINFLKNLAEKGIEAEKNEARVEVLKNKYIGTKPATTLFYTTKLELNKNNDNFYKQYLTEFKPPININKLKSSEKLLYDAYYYFVDKLNIEFKDDNGTKVTNFLENIIANKLYLIQIIVDDDLSAYTVFETLNARGVDLTTTDLLKNYLFSLASKDGSDIQILQNSWTEIVDSVGFKDFPNFLRYYINSKKSLVRHNRLYKELKSEITNSSKVFELIEELKKFVYLYIAIKNPSDEFWNGHPKHQLIRKYLEEMNIFGVTQPIPVLFAVHSYLPELFSDALIILSVISFRYNIIGKLNPNELEKVYNNLAKKISNKEVINKKQILEHLRSIYINDDEFENTFSTKSISTKVAKKIVKYILVKLENQISNIEHNYENSEITIEHILPENYTNDWTNSFSTDIDSYLYRLGNYTLLNDGDNRKAGVHVFEKKAEIYKLSGFKLSSDKINYDSWNSGNLNTRQRALAKIAKTVWKVDFET